MDKELFSDAQTFVELTVNVLTDSRQFLDLMIVLNKHSDHLYAHSIGVAMYSVMIAKKMGFQSNQAFFKLGMAAMFHDIGKKEIDSEILQKHRSLLTAEEKKLLDSHVIRGQEILSSLRTVPDDVIQLVFEHHEDYAGQGYPMGQDKKYQHPLSPIIQLSNAFVDLALIGHNNPGMPSSEAIAHLELTMRGRFDKKVMDALKQLFK